LKIYALEADYKLYDLILKFLVIKLSDKELEQEMKSDEIDNAVEETKEKTPATKSESDNGVEEVKEKD
jgi:Arc/MetJ family transcription regulator